MASLARLTSTPDTVSFTVCCPRAKENSPRSFMAVMRCSSTSPLASSSTDAMIGDMINSLLQSGTYSTTPSSATFLTCWSLSLRRASETIHSCSTTWRCSSGVARSRSDLAVAARFEASASRTLLSSSCTASSRAGSTPRSASWTVKEATRSGSPRTHTSRRSGCWLREKLSNRSRSDHSSSSTSSSSAARAALSSPATNPSVSILRQCAAGISPPRPQYSSSTS
mmetsp:Transcript_57942/g.137922  ORF Transcript_57942/g.137922 Transcript_57942/m.137922 type:complete len:225 (+) Transcript_57942:1363-2037(+)